MAATNVPPVEFTPTGLSVPEESAILAGVQADFNDAFGGSMNLQLDTPQGQLATSEAAIIANNNAAFAEFVNQVNPDTADGFMQDATARIYFLDRSPGEPTVAQCLCTGLVGTIIPVGAQVQDTSGNNYIATLQGSIGNDGTVTLPFACTVNGPTPCPANTVTIIYRAIAGWDTVNNPSDGIAGAFVESQQAFALRRTQSVALNAHGSLPSIYAAVFDVPDVIDVYVTENTTNGTVMVGSTNYPLVAHSLLVSVVGGNATAIAQAIWNKKDVGCDYNGNTTETVTDQSGYSIPFPTYSVTFEIPPALPILFAVQIADSDDLPSNIIDLTQAAIVAAFTGADGSQRVRIGSLLLASKFYQAVQAIGNEVSVLSILLGSATPTLTSQLIGVDQAPTVVAGDISVTLI